MDVSFERTGERGYATVVTLPGRAPRRMDPAPGYDEDIPHDLVHYMVEAELGLAHAVYGRALAGGGSFRETVEAPGDRRRRARAQRRLNRREAALRRGHHADMATSEHFASICDIAWRRRAGARPPEGAERRHIPEEDIAKIGRVLDRLDAAAPLWRAVPVGGSLTFTWPRTTANPPR
ncbi:hypothetical protein [Actinomadura litoris]|uniref:Uncharacterized protein n=1 Tax=Actinomadura litoris TaxID=2678616 RepID=A0A7K1LCK9_9ACTN|nr:hypothetical protein [Actinomadura litoris]MUN42159.1 hypothetical protein [Actinomadura litoris]